MNYRQLGIDFFNWVGPNFCNSETAEDLGFKFNNWQHLDDLLARLGTDGAHDPLRLLLGYAVTEKFYSRVMPKDLLNAKMQVRASRASLGNVVNTRGYSWDLPSVQIIRDSVPNSMRFMRRRLGYDSVIWSMLEHGLDPKQVPPREKRAQVAYTAAWEHHQEMSLDSWWPQAEMLSVVLGSMHFVEDNPKVVYWYDDPEIAAKPTQGRLTDMKVRSARWPKFLQMLNRKFGFRFSEDDMQRLATWVGENLKAPDYKIKIVDGDLISEYYGKEYFGSCMYESSAPEFYDHQENVSLMVITDGNTGQYLARALVWRGHYNDGSPVTVMDRVYPSDGGAHIRAATKYAKDQGWEYKVRHSISGELSTDRRITVEVRDVNKYPYMDTFLYASYPEGRNFVLSNKSGVSFPYILDSTGNNEPWEEVSCCDNCGEHYHDDDMTWIGDAAVCDNCRNELYVYCEFEGEYILTDEAVELDNVSPTTYASAYSEYVVYSEVDDVHYWTGPGRQYLYRRTTVEDVECLTGGLWEGDYTTHYVTVETADGDTVILHEEDTEALAKILEEGGERL